MSYEKHTWTVGDKITSARLNNMENGIANSGCIILEPTIIGDPTQIEAASEQQATVTLPVSYNDIIGYINNGQMIFLKMPQDEQGTGFEIFQLLEFSYLDELYKVTFDGNLNFSSESADGELTIISSLPDTNHPAAL